MYIFHLKEWKLGKHGRANGRTKLCQSNNNCLCHRHTANKSQDRNWRCWGILCERQGLNFTQIQVSKRALLCHALKQTDIYVWFKLRQMCPERKRQRIEMSLLMKASQLWKSSSISLTRLFEVKGGATIKLACVHQELAKLSHLRILSVHLRTVGRCIIETIHNFLHEIKGEQRTKRFPSLFKLIL